MNHVSVASVQTSFVSLKSADEWSFGGAFALCLQVLNSPNILVGLVSLADHHVCILCTAVCNKERRLASDRIKIAWVKLYHKLELGIIRTFNSPEHLKLPRPQEIYWFQTLWRKQSLKTTLFSPVSRSTHSGYYDWAERPSGILENKFGSCLSPCTYRGRGLSNTVVGAPFGLYEYVPLGLRNTPNSFWRFIDQATRSL